MTSAKTTVRNKTHRNKYDYEQDWPEKVHLNVDNGGNAEYTFEHDELGTRKRVKVGNQVLFENFYSNEEEAGHIATRPKNLTSMTKANEDGDRGRDALLLRRAEPPGDGEVGWSILWQIRTNPVCANIRIFEIKHMQNS